MLRVLFSNVELLGSMSSRRMRSLLFLFSKQGEEEREVFEEYFTSLVVGELLPAEQSNADLRNRHLQENELLASNFFCISL